MVAAAGLALLPAAPLLPATDSIEGVVELIEKLVSNAREALTPAAKV